MEYTLFQPGLFAKYIAFPYKTAEHLEPLNNMIDFQNCQAIVIDGYDSVMTYTTVQDLAAVVTKAIDLVGEWPVIGGIGGSKGRFSQIIQIGEKVRGMIPYAPQDVVADRLDRIFYHRENQT